MVPVRLPFLALAIFLSSTAAFASGNSTGPVPAPTPIALPDASQPSEALTPYIVHLDSLLALGHIGSPPVQEFCALAPGRLLVLRQQFLARQSEAPDDRKPSFAAAAATCDLLTAAVDERQRTVGDITASRQVKGSGKLDEPSRKETLTQGIQGGSTAKAVGAIVERDRERQFLADGRARSGSAEAALEAMALNRWNQRSLELRRKIAAAYAQVR